MYVRKIKAGFNTIRNEVERELDLENLKKEFSDEQLNSDKLFGYDEFEDTIKEVKDEIDGELEEIYQYADDPLKTKYAPAQQHDILANKDPNEHAGTGVETTPTETATETARETATTTSTENNK